MCAWILDLSLLRGERSILSIGSQGAGSEFKDNAAKAIASGYKPCAVYMSVNPDIAYLSSVYRSADLYDKIIFQNQGALSAAGIGRILFPRR